MQSQPDGDRVRLQDLSERVPRQKMKVEVTAGPRAEGGDVPLFDMRRNLIWFRELLC